MPETFNKGICRSDRTPGQLAHTEFMEVEFRARPNRPAQEGLILARPKQAKLWPCGVCRSWAGRENARAL